jgi:hypothetical protein
VNFSVVIMVLAAIAGAVGFEVLVGLTMNVMLKRDQSDSDAAGLLGS